MASRVDRQAIRDNVRLVSVVESTNVTDAELNTIINQGVHEVGVQENWPFLQASATITLVKDQQTYTLPADWNRTEALVDDDEDTEVPFMAATQFFKSFGNDTGNSSSTPDFFTVWEGSIYLNPIPDAADTNRLTHYYYKNPTAMATDGATPEWDEAFHWILVEYTLWKLYNREEYYDQSERAFVTYVRYLNDMAAFYMSQVRRHPFIWGDGSSRRFGDLNIPFLRRI